MSGISVILPSAEGELKPYILHEAGVYEPVPLKRQARHFYVEAHTVADPMADISPFLGGRVDIEASIACRKRLWDMGLGIAEAADGAQRGYGLAWEQARDLIRHSIDEASNYPGLSMFCAVNSDQLPDQAVPHELAAVRAAYEEQCAAVEGMGGRLMLLPSIELLACNLGKEEYARFYGDLLDQAAEPVVLVFSSIVVPSGCGYWGAEDIDDALTAFLSIVMEKNDKIDGIKIALEDPQRILGLRSQLPAGVTLYAGCEQNYIPLTAGDEAGHYCHAMLGVFDCLAPIVATALSELSGGNDAPYRNRLAPTVKLARALYEQGDARLAATGTTMLAYLNGQQDHFAMLGGRESALSTLSMVEIFKQADRARLYTDPSLAAARMKTILRLRGVSE